MLTTNRLKHQHSNKPIVQNSIIATLWNKITKNAIQRLLAGTNFMVPYETISVRKLVTRAELARDTTDKTSPYSYFGRKVSRKMYRYPFSGTEYMVIKTNRGGSSQLFFNVIDTSESIRTKQLNLNNLVDLETTLIDSLSQFTTLVQDERLVQLKRITMGSNTKGSEFQTQYYLSYQGATPTLNTILQENVHKSSLDPIVENNSYISQGAVVNYSSEKFNVTLFVKIQSKQQNGPIFFIAGKYENTCLTQTSGLCITLRQFPIFEEIFKEQPLLFLETLFDITKAAPCLDAVQFPASLDIVTILECIEKHKPLNSVDIRGKNIGTVVKSGDRLLLTTDPEAYLDVCHAIRSLQESFRDNLLAVYFYGSVPRGFKCLQSDIDILAVIANKASTAETISHFVMKDNSQGDGIFDESLGNYWAPSVLYPFRNIEMHTIRENDFKNHSKNLRLGEFLYNISENWVEIYKKKTRGARFN